MSRMIRTTSLEPGMRLIQTLHSGTKGVALKAGYIFRPSSLPRRIYRLLSWGFEEVTIEDKLERPPETHLFDITLAHRRILANEKEIEYVRSTIEEEAQRITVTLKDNMSLNDLQLRYLESSVRDLVESELFEEYFRRLVKYDRKGLLILEHSLNVMYYSMLLCWDIIKRRVDRQLVTTNVSVAAFLHDVGYLKALEQPWWHKSGSDFLENSYRSLKAHVDQIEPELQRLSKGALYIRIVKHHHSYLDGSGYPKTPEEGLSEYTQLLQVCDIYDIGYFRYTLDKITERNFTLADKINLEYYDRLLEIVET